MDFNKLLNEYATEEMSAQELNEKAENLAKALVTNTQTYGLTPTAVSYAGFEKQAGLQPSSSIASKDLTQLNTQLEKNSLQPLISREKNPKLSFKEVKDAFQQRFSSGSYFNKEVAEFSDEVRKILREKPAEYDTISQKKYSEKEIAPDNSIPQKIIQKVVKDVADNFPSIEIVYDSMETENAEVVKRKVEYISKGKVTIKPRSANQEERGSLTTKLKQKIMDLLTKNVNDQELLKSFQIKKDWASLILGAFDKCEKILNDPKNIIEMKDFLGQTIINAAVNKNDVTIVGNNKKLKLEIKGASSSKAGSFKLLELAILSSHKRKDSALQNLLVNKGISNYDNLVKNFYDPYIVKIAAPRTIELPEPIFIYLASTATDTVMEVNSIGITYTGKASKFIRATINNKEKINTTLGNLLKNKGLV